ncbi:MAG: hypothetical protein AUJ32_01095 [Parcubacteria group bacterium CG1_02_40_82]|uniref:ComEC/Rec2-related protein domain-containing protein n=4 Tax=Candidatus Portnoyibacteriota TaxID=1817913 RepID=A0A2M7IHC4_9BACT|nr:MAG: hypothetical protein AUJ32_01095 [Parcubacteria group bacterium CG1_02_40_82]PIQ75306.1 MAG: hypothetical protein COV84_01955 [Candidatus Portnoybacteria bacterium CG11_big_fil_rev_8_21_14_0_20_40_15]PIS30939.1 MAG: hypothetical protein COT41_02770 [Candidatus Portnoybacteria bacterium CG08_land_8_20_14_0_20_40_83]PIW75933.1 MAG: hypothetical protein CO001_04045 [Candidatus Portnoybacteria bacterium CG_4_8_14_3_um_filter_40_10]PIY74922.1 MAG: hypothetical protein COY85_01910 [Candidatus
MTKSKIFLYFCLSFVVGVFIESLVKIPFIALGGFFILGMILTSVFWPIKKTIIAAFCLMIMALGGARFLEKEQVGTLSQLNGEGRLKIVGVINDLPDRRQTSQKLILEARQIMVSGKTAAVNGLALITVKPYPIYQYGDLLEISGRLEEPESFGPSDDGFDYKTYLAKSDIYSIILNPEIKILAQNQGNYIKQILFSLKQKYENSIESLMGEPQASFLAGLNLGQNKQISPELSDAFKKTGTSHIVALSGYNISIIASFFMTIFGWLMLRRSLRFWLAVAAILFFTILTGASASVVRAAIMGILVLLARHAGRMYNVRNALVFAGAVMIYLNPKILRFDIGFQLSFLATAGLVWLAPFFEKALKNLPKIFGLREVLTATLSAQLAVLPILIVYFGQLSIISPLANLVVLLFIPLTMLVGFLAGGVGIIWIGGAKIFGWLAWLFLTFEIGAIKFFAGLPLSSIKMNWGWPFVIFYYLILIGLLYLFYNKKKEILVEKWAEK